MIHLGIDHHKKYSHVVAMTDSGEICWDGQLDSTREAFRLLKESLPTGEPVQCVLEAGRNWGILYDALEELGMNPKLANPLKMRLIAETFTKTDKIDATTHAVILKAGLTPLVHVPSKRSSAPPTTRRSRPSARPSSTEKSGAAIGLGGEPGPSRCWPPSYAR